MVHRQVYVILSAIIAEAWTFLAKLGWMASHHVGEGDVGPALEALSGSKPQRLPVAGDLLLTPKAMGDEGWPPGPSA